MKKLPTSKSRISKSKVQVLGTADPQNVVSIVQEGLRQFSDNLEHFNNLREKVQERFEQQNRQRANR